MNMHRVSRYTRSLQVSSRWIASLFCLATTTRLDSRSFRTIARISSCILFERETPKIRRTVAISPFERKQFALDAPSVLVTLNYDVIIFFIARLVAKGAKAINDRGNARCGRVFRHANSPDRAAVAFSLRHPALDVVAGSRVLTLNSARERRMAKVIIGAHAAYVSRFVELIKPRPTIPLALHCSFIRFIASPDTLDDCRSPVFQFNTIKEHSYIKSALLLRNYSSCSVARDNRFKILHTNRMLEEICAHLTNILFISYM